MTTEHKFFPCRYVINDEGKRCLVEIRIDRTFGAPQPIERDGTNHNGTCLGRRRLRERQLSKLGYPKAEKHARAARTGQLELALPVPAGLAHDGGRRRGSR